MAVHSCAMGLSSQSCVDRREVERHDEDRRCRWDDSDDHTAPQTRTHSDGPLSPPQHCWKVAGWGNQPHFASVVAGTLPDMESQSSNGPVAHDHDEAEFDPEFDQARAMLDDARQRLREVPAEVVVTNHVMGLYELAAIHLAATPPDLGQARLAIDAVGLLVEGLGDRIGDEAPTLMEALSTLRLAFVQVSGSTG